MAKRVIEIELIGDASKLSKGFKEGEQASGKFGSSLKKVGAVAATAAVGGVGLAAKFLTDSAKAASEAQAAMAKVKTNVDNAGISYNKHAKEIDKVITAQSRMSGFDDEELAESFSNMVRTTGSLSEAYKLNVTAMGLARTKGMSLNAAQSLLARVYNGNYMGLKKLGIAYDGNNDAVTKLKATHDKFTPAQLKAAQAIDKAKSSTEAIALIQDKFKGQAEAYGKTAAGASERLGVAWENLQESAGQFLLPIITTVTKAIAGFVEGMTDGTGAGGRFVEIIKQTGQVFSDIWGAIGPIVQAVWKIIYANIQNIIGVFKIVSDLLHGDFGAAWGEFKAIVSRTVEAIVGYVEALAGTVGKAALNVGKALVSKIIEGLGSITGTIGGAILDVFDMGRDWVQNSLGRMASFGASIVSRIVSGFGSIIGTIGGAIGEVFDLGREWISTALSDVGSLGGKIISALYKGITGAVDFGASVAKFIGDGLGAAINGTKKVAGIIGDVASYGTAVGKAIIHAIGDAISDAPGVIKDALVSALKKAAGLLGKVGGVVSKALGAIGVPGFAAGTNFAPGGLALVGEQGPEFVELPRGSKVHPAPQTQAMLSGAGQTIINFNGPVGSSRAARVAAEMLAYRVRFGTA